MTHDQSVKLTELAGGLHDKLARSHPSLERGQVWCRTCGFTERVSSSYAIKHGWPKHCGYTMTIDSPDEQVALAHLPTTPMDTEKSNAD